MTLTPAQLDTLCERSARGEGVRAVLREFGCDDDETLLWLQANAHKRLVNAKQEFQGKPPKHPEPEHQVRREKR